MRLEVEFEPPRDRPDAEEVHRVLRRLSVSGPKFAVLDTGPNHYIQAYAVQDGLFDVEYREGGPERHYGSGLPQPRDVVVDAFLSYLRQDDHWRTALEWRRMDLP